ncbi:MAG: carboxymuconolactone decarboxylase family protein [candidate division Zixibacteria bacterium]
MEFNPLKSRSIFDSEKHDRLEKIFSRDALSQRLRFLSCVSCLQALGDSDELISILKLAIENSGDLGDIYEVLLQGYLFCGYPRAIESFFSLQEALSSIDDLDPGNYTPRHFEPSESLLERGIETHRTVHGTNFEKMRNKISALCPDLGYLMIAEGYGHILSRGDLELKARELAVVSSITAIDSDRQLNSHIRGCRNVGCEDIEIYESIFTGLLWLPAERVEGSLEVWSKITGSVLSESTDDYKK